MVSRILAIHTRVQAKAMAIATRYNETRDTIDGLSVYRAFAGASVPVCLFFDAYSASLFSLPTTFASVGGAAVMGLATVAFSRSIQFHKRLLSEKPINRLRNAQGEHVTSALTLPHLVHALDHLPANFPDDVNVDEEALKLIAAMNPNIEL